MAIKMIRDFIKLESAGGIFLGLAALFALVMKNSPLSGIYDLFLTLPLSIQIGTFIIQKPLLLWINDGLMAVFFLLVGLEIKREILEGQLSSRKQISLPAFAALGGLIIPALIYVAVTWQTPQYLQGWAIPAATDIAFALGIVTLLGNRVPRALKVCLVAIAILDDLAAILIIALFYTENLSLTALGLGSLGLVPLFLFNQKGVTSLAPYILTGIFIWACVLKSGIHPTLAGVLVAFFIPLRGTSSKDAGPLHTLEKGLHPWVSYAILPIFAFANAGISLKGLSMDMLMHPISLGIILGLFIGKQIGVMGFTAFGRALRSIQLPRGVTWTQYYGMALITGVGFTMSLFIGTLAFEEAETLNTVRLGVITGSILSGVLGYVVLSLASQHSGEELNRKGKETKQ